MRRSTLAMCALLAVTTTGCERVKGLIAKFRGDEQPAATPTPATVRDTARRDTVRRAPAVAAAPRPTRQAPPVTGPPRPLQDLPFASTDTGTIAPGMTERDVYTVWGPPVMVRRLGEWTYLFFRNGCEYSCGTHDVVFLHNGAVVDAIVRWWGHIYAGQSSSPPDRMPEPTRGGDTLVLPPQPPPTP